MLKPSSTLPPITFDVYQADYLALGRKHERGDRRKVMSNSELKSFAKCPSRWRRGQSFAGSDATEWGTLVDCLVLTPDRFEEQFAICPEEYPAPGKKKDDPIEMKAWNWNAGYCKEWRAKQEAVGKVCVKADWASDGHAAKARLMGDPQIRAYIESCQSQVQVCVDWHDPATGIVVPVKTLIDLLPSAQSQFRQSLGDLKTTSFLAHSVWENQVMREGYNIQAALYLDAYNVVTGERRNEFRHVVQESERPYEIGRRIVGEEMLERGREAYMYALRWYCKCLANDQWPGFDDPDDEFPSDSYALNLNGWTVTELNASHLRR